MHGPATGTISPLQRATADNACQLVNGWESTLAPTTNQVAPRMDFAFLGQLEEVHAGVQLIQMVEGFQCRL